MQNYKEIALTDVARDAVMQLQENIKTIASSYAGTAFPTENLIDGMLCFRTDERKYYTYNAETETWEYGLAKALKYKGQAESYSDLPTEGNEVGDMWNIQKADKTAGIKAGDNVAWSGTEWDNMGGKVDLSDYALVADQQKDVTSATSSGATITLIQRDGTKLPFTIDNVANATKAAQDGNGNNIASTYATKTSVASVAKYSSASTGSGVNPVYLSSGTVTASTSSVGASNKPIYMSSGALTASSSTIGGTAQPLYMSSGSLTALSATVGSSTKPVYLSSGTITASNSTVGGTSTPIYLNNGTFTACTMTSYATQSWVTEQINNITQSDSIYY